MSEQISDRYKQDRQLKVNEDGSIDVTLLNADIQIGAVEIKDGDSDRRADVLLSNGFNALAAVAPGHISTDNSTSDILLADAVYTGTYEDITNFGVIVVTLKTSHVSATDGLCVDFSSDGTNVDSTDVYTIPANTGKTFSFQTATKFYRIRYINGGTNQTSFRLQTSLKPYYVKPSSHRIQDSIIDEDDAELVKAVITGKKANGTFDNVNLTNGSNMKVSIEEYETTTNPIRSDIEGNGKNAVGTTEVEVVFTGTPTNSIIISADTSNTGQLYIGKTGVTNDGSNAIVFLEAGESVTIDYDDVDNALYVVSDTAAQNFWAGATL